MYATTTSNEPATSSIDTNDTWLEDLEDELASANEYFDKADTYSDTSSERKLLTSMARDEYAHALVLKDLLTEKEVSIPDKYLTMLTQVKERCQSFRG